MLLDYLLRSGLEVTSCPLGRISTTSCPELTLIVKSLFVLLSLQIFMKILEFLMQSFLLNFAISDWLIKHIFVLLSQICQLCCLFVAKSIESSFHFLTSFFHPHLFFFSFHIKDLLLYFMSLCESKYIRKYNFCLTMCSSIFLRLSNSEVSLTLGLSCTSSSCLV